MMDFILTLIASVCSFFLGLALHHWYVKKFLSKFLIDIGSTKMFRHMENVIRTCVKNNNNMCKFTTEKEEFTLKIVEVKDVKFG